MLMEAQMLLRDPDIFPSGEVLNDILGDAVYSVLESFLGIVADEGLEPEWRYYNDGKAWLCKITNKKKTILWLSIWEGFFKTSFFFTEKHLEGVAALDISEKIKDNFSEAKPTGRLIPMIIDVREKDQIKDLPTIIRFKKSLK